MKKISVIGAGIMGTGIAQVAATHGCIVNLIDSDPDALLHSKSNLHSVLNRLITKVKISEEDSKNILSKINWSIDMEDITHSELVIEAVIENMEVKQKIFSQIESLVSKDCIITTNTSSLSVSGIASVCSTRSRVLGIHFFNPVPLMKLVEVIPTEQTNITFIDDVISTLKSWEKTVVTAKDTPGFIVNRIARPYYGEALRIYEEGIADFVTIDWAMKKIGGFRMGPFELMDYIGNDVNYNATEAIFIGSNYNPRYKPSPTQKRMVDNRLLGRKSGKGYYDYSHDAAIPSPQKDEESGKQIFNRILAMLINEAADALNLSIASRDDIDTAMTTGVNYPKGLLKWADEIGVKSVDNQLKKLHSNSDDDRYKSSPLLIKMGEENTTFYA